MLNTIFFSRVLLMLQKLSREGSANIFDLADEYDVDDRTIRRDVKRLHYFPIEIKKNIVTFVDGYSIEHSKLQDIEFLIAELALSSIEGIDTSLDKHLHSIRAKLSHPLFFNPYKIKADAYEEINMDSELLNKIEDAIKKRNVSKVYSNQLVSTVHPYKVISFDGFWYLLAKDTEDDKIKTYLIANIEEFRASSEVYASQYVNIDEILENVHTAWFEDGNSFEVKVKIKSEIAHYFTLKNHLSSQVILKENADGSIIVSFNVSSDEDVDYLIKSWLPHIEVIKPERLRKKMISELENYVKDLKNITI